MINILEALGLPTLPDDLVRVERALSAALAAEDPFLNEVAGHLIGAGGKRLRPALAIAAAAAVGAPASDDVIQGGTAVELVHIGSLYHDDVMDEADMRRGVESVNHRWGNLVAILAGDYLLARASEIAASLGTEVAGLLADTIGRLCDGQVERAAHAVRGRPFRSGVLHIDHREDGVVDVGGMPHRRRSSPAPTGADVDTLTDFGLKFGITFQIADDILDVVGTDEELGKPAGHDLEEGVYTLPVPARPRDPRRRPGVAAAARRTRHP